jgi:hypothetical protein
MRSAGRSEKLMAVDRPDGNSDDDQAEAAGRPAGKPIQLPKPAETRDRAEYYDALRAAMEGSGHRGDRLMKSGVATEATGWDVIDAADRPPLDKLFVPTERASHLLDGDGNGGGHRFGTGRPGKTEFPADWDDAKILRVIQDVARAPDQPPIFQSWNGRWLTRGTRDGVEIVVIVAHDGRIWSGWPRPGGPGVVKNPEEA